MLDLAAQFQSALWLPAAGVSRSFVRHPHPGTSPAATWHYPSQASQTLLSIVIPTSDAYRDGYLPSLLSQIGCQEFPNFELIVVRGDTRQGRAINIGAALAQGKYVMTLDDDTSLPDPETFTKLVDVMETCPEIGIAGGNNVVPQGAGPFVRQVMQQLPRRCWEPVEHITDSDLAEHPCLIMRLEEFKAVGGENELLPRGLDPYLREQFRLLAKRVVVIPEVNYHHLPPAGLKKLLRQFYRNGRHAAFVNLHYPQWVIETPAGHGFFHSRCPFLFRVVRFPVRLLSALLSGKPLLLLCELSYAFGFSAGSLSRGKEGP